MNENPAGTYRVQKAEGRHPSTHNYDTVWQVLFITKVNKEAWRTELLPGRAQVGAGQERHPGRSNI